jgi:septal ring factor EnvC (AmiA/AmiB activator)
MNQTIINDPRARRWGNVAKYGVLLVAGFLVAPYIWISITGLLGLLVAAGVILAAWMVRPVVFSMAANLRLKFIKAEASRNPVETLQNDLKAKTEALGKRKEAIETLNSQIRTFSDKVDEIKGRYGAEDSGYQKLSRDLSDLRRVYAHRCEKWKEAREQLERYAEEIKRANMIWDAAQAAAAARETSGLTEDEFFAKLRAETAFDSIQKSYNDALASLDTALLDGPSTATLDAAAQKRTLTH